MKIMHLGDLHIGKTVNGFSMLGDQRYILEKILGTAEEKKVSTVMICGDVYDKSVPSAEAVSLFDSFLTALHERGLNVLMISGNHDSAERLSFASGLMEESGVYISRQISDTVKKVVLEDEYGRVCFYMLPFLRPVDIRRIYGDESVKTYDDAVRTAVSRIPLDKNERNIIMAHQFITGAERSDSELLSVGGLDNVGADVFGSFDYTALGHIHRPQKIKDNIRYCGSILKYSASEAAFEKSVPIIDIRCKGSIETELVPLVPQHDVKVFKGTYSTLMSADFYRDKDREDYVFAVLTDRTEEPDAARKLRVVYPRLMNVSYEMQDIGESTFTVPSETAEGLDPLGLVQRFYEEMYRVPMDREKTEIISELIKEIWEGEK